MKPPRAEMSPSKGKGAFTALWLTIMMAAQSFKKRTIPSLPPAPDGELHSAKAVQEWIKEAKDVVSAEGMEWITNAAETIELDDATQVHSLAGPDNSRMCIELDGMAKLEITHTSIHSKLVRIFNEHGAAAPQYDALQAGKNYTDDMVESDWKIIMPEIQVVLRPCSPD